MVTNNTFYMNEVNNETESALSSQLGGLLGVAKRSDGQYHLADFCQANTVNIWSRKGPFAYPSWNFDYDPLNPDASNAARAAARASIKHGIIPYELTTEEKSALSSNAASNASSLPAIFNEPNRGWTMNMKPTGGEAAPNRLRDFDGYYHLQVPTLYPIRVVDGYTGNEDYLKDVGSIDFFTVPSDKQYFDLVASGAEYSVAHIPLAELSDTIRNMYAGVFVARAAKVGWLPTPGTISRKTIIGDRLGDNDEFRVRVDYSNFTKGWDYYIIPMLFGNTDVPSTWSDRVVYLLPQEPRSLVSFLSSDLEYSAIVGTGQAVAGQTGVYKFTFEITIYNPSERTIIVNDNFMRFGAEGTLNSQTVKLPDGIGLLTNNPYHTTIELNIQTFSSTWTWPVFFSLNGGEYTHEITFE